MKIKHIFFSAFILFSVESTVAQTPQRFYDKSKCGYKLNNQIIVPATYDAGSDFINGSAIVIKANKRGFINERGIVIISFDYEDAGPFMNGLAKVKKNGK